MPEKKFATIAEAKVLGDRVCRAIRKSTRLKGLGADYRAYPLVRGALLFLTVGTLWNAKQRGGYSTRNVRASVLPTESDLMYALGLAHATQKKLGFGDAAILIMPPILRIHALTNLYDRMSKAVGEKGDKRAVFNIMVGSADHGIHPQIKDLRRMGVLMRKCLKGHGPAAWIIEPAVVLASSSKVTSVSGKTR